MRFGRSVGRHAGSPRGSKKAHTDSIVKEKQRRRYIERTTEEVK